MNERIREESQWVEAARRGDEAAFEALVRRYERPVLALTRRLCGDPDDAEEAAQEAFLAAWQGLPFFRGDAAFSTWLYRLASNASVDLLRREGRHRAAAGPSLDDEEVHVDVPSAAPGPQEAAERRELREQVAAGLERLNREQREVLVLRELHQLRYDEIAQVLDLDVGTVKSRINRGRKRLQQFLMDSGNFSPPAPSKGEKRRAAHEEL